MRTTDSPHAHTAGCPPDTYPKKKFTGAGSFARSAFAVRIELADMRIGRIGKHAFAHQKPGILTTGILQDLPLIDPDVIMRLQLAYTLVKRVIHQFLDPLRKRRKIRLAVIKPIAEQMTFPLLVKQRRKLDRGNDLDPCVLSRLAHLVYAAHAVMIRQSDQRKPALPGDLDQPRRRMFPILAVTRMQMKVKIVHVHHPAHYNLFSFFKQQKQDARLMSILSCRFIQPAHGRSARKDHLPHQNP